MKIKNICCIGAGYVGGPTMAVIALKCPEIKVTVVDLNADRISAWNGSLENLPIYEPGLSDVVNIARGRNLFFSEDIDKAIDQAEMIFMAVNTPTKTEGEGAGMAADLSYVESCARTIARVSITDKIIVEKSTLPVRTAEKIKEILDSEGNGVNFEILSNPEFLAEGTAIEDLFKSDRVLIGGDPSSSGQKAIKALVDIYISWIPRDKIITTNVWSSELAKLASNAMLAQRISSINSLSALCEKTGADIEELSKAIGMDHRIGSHFLKASVGFGGSCFKKDILNLVYLCQYYDLDEVAEYWLQIIKINSFQKLRFSKKLLKSTIEYKNKQLTILGWAFKKDTNDSRESPAIFITDYLLRKGLRVTIYDPMIFENQIENDLIDFMKTQGLNMKIIKSYLKNLKVCNSLQDAVKNSNVIGIITEWDEFKSNELKEFINNKNEVIKVLDGRNILDFKTHYSIGK